LGRLVKDVELKYSTSNTAIVNFTIAVDNPYGKEENNKTFFINCVAFGKTAEFVANYCPKGTRIGVTGSLQTRTWTDKEDKKHFVTEVAVNNVYFADGKTNNNSKKSTASDDEDFEL
jgi:single-strand DNA-binding protein